MQQSRTTEKRSELILHIPLLTAVIVVSKLSEVMHEEHVHGPRVHDHLALVVRGGRQGVAPLTDSGQAVVGTAIRVINNIVTVTAAVGDQ